MRKKAVILIIALALIGLAGFTVVPKIRNHQTRMAALKCINNLRCLDGGKQQWALENRQTSNAVPSWDAIAPYIVNCFYQDNNWTYTNYTGPLCPKNGNYTIGRIADAPTCTVVNHDPELLGGYVRVKDAESRFRYIEGANVVVIDETGQRKSGLTDENGCAEIVTWPKKVTWFIVSKDGFVTFSNSFPFHDDVVLEEVSK